MAATIYYFSGTGNSLAAAKTLADSLQPCRLVPVVRALKEPNLLENSDECVGIVTPVYFFGLPNIVARFLKTASFHGAKYIFLIATAGHPFGVALTEANGYLKAKGQSLSYGAYIFMPDNYLPFYNVSTDKAKRILAGSEKRLAALAGELAARKTSVVDRLNAPLVGPLARWWHETNCARFAADDRYFTTTDKCISCGICEKVCPVGNIRLVDGRPQWLGRCEQCFACLHFCPVAAIEFRNKTRGKHRYHHPAVSWQEIGREKREPSPARVDSKSQN
jgi:ferredoxin/flavodoxin